MTVKPLTFTASEVSRYACVNQETLRVWRRRGYFGPIVSDGWTRYRWGDLFAITVFAEVVNSTGSHDHAKEVCQIARVEMGKFIFSKDEDNVPPYILTAHHPDSGTLLELIDGVENLGEVIARQMASKRHFGQYSVVDLGAILHRLFSRLTEEKLSTEAAQQVAQQVARMIGASASEDGEV